MNDLDVIDIFLTEIENLGYETTTQYSLPDHNPEQVLIDNWDSDSVLRATSTYNSIATDDNGNPIGENHHFYYDMTVDLQVISEDEQTAMERRQDIVNHFRQYKSNPTEFHDDVVLFETGSGGLREPMFEPTSLRVHRMVQSFDLEFVDSVDYENVDELAEIEVDLEVT